MKNAKLSKQRIDRILNRYYETLQANRASDKSEIMTLSNNITMVSGGQWESAQAHRRKHIVKRILVDFEKRGAAPNSIPVDLI